jgi:hypothetical protein
MDSVFIDDCLLLLKSENVKYKIKEFINPILHPIISILLKEIYPYIFLSLIFVIISFLLHLGIFILLLRNKSTL